MVKVFTRKWTALLVVVALGLAGQGRADHFRPFPDDEPSKTQPYHGRDAIFTAIANVPADAGVVYDEFGNTDTIEIWNFSTQVYVGPFDVTSTLDRIRYDDWMPAHFNDGVFFNFSSDRELPNIPRLGHNYYMEFVVWPAIDLDAGTYDRGVLLFDSVIFPGPMRILLGAGGEVYFSGDHYGQGPHHLPAYYVNPTGP